MKYAVGIDVGGTNTRVALINEKYEIKERVQFGSDPKNPIKTLNQINDVIKGFGEKIEGIGISCPGPLDLINGIILTPPNLPGWHNFELTKELEKITGISVQLENDANPASFALFVMAVPLAIDSMEPFFKSPCDGPFFHKMQFATSCANPFAPR